MRQKITLELTVEIDYEAGRALRGTPGTGGPNGELPITGLDLMMTDLRADLLEIVANDIKEGSDLARLAPITLGCAIRYGEPFTPAYEAF